MDVRMDAHCIFTQLCIIKIYLGVRGKEREIESRLERS